MKKLLAAFLMLWCAVANAQWITPPYVTTDFKGSASMTWTVPYQAVNQQQFRYTLVGNTLTWIFQLEGTTLGGTVSNELALRMPQGKKATGWFSQPVCFATFVDPVTTGWISVPAYITTGQNNPFMGVVKMSYVDQRGVYHPTGENWDVWPGNPTLNLYCGPVILEVQ